MTEREKQAAGLPFDGANEELQKLHLRAQGLLRKPPYGAHRGVKIELLTKICK